VRRSWIDIIVLLVFGVFCTMVIPVAAETGCEIYYDNCQYECGQLKNEIADLDYNARSVFDCHERICSIAFEDKFCSIAEYAPCMQNVMDAYFSCMRSCSAKYRQTTDTAERSDIRNFCPGDCVCNFYRDLYLTCDKSVCDDYCKEQGYLNSQFIKKGVICRSGDRTEYQYNCECSGTPTATPTPVVTTKVTTIPTTGTPVTTRVTPVPTTTPRERTVTPPPQPAQAEQPPPQPAPQPQPQPVVPDIPDIDNLFWIILDWLGRLFGGSAWDAERALQPAPQQQPVPQQQPAVPPAQISTDPDPNRGNIGQPPNLDGTCDEGANINGICRLCGRWGERCCPPSYGFVCEPRSECRGGRCMVIDTQSRCGQVGTKPCDQAEGYDHLFCYEGVFDWSSYSCIVCGQLYEPCCQNTDYPCDRPYRCEGNICVPAPP